MLYPNQFTVDEAWIVFTLNDEPIHTIQDGDFNFLALMDAASCYILGSSTVPASQGEPTREQAAKLLHTGRALKNSIPEKLFIPEAMAGRYLIAEAELLGIDVLRVTDKDLLPIIGEARQVFRARFGRPGAM